MSVARVAGFVSAWVALCVSQVGQVGAPRADRPGSAQVVSGVVVSVSQERPVAGATVTLSSGSIQETRRTDEGGRFSFGRVLPGRYGLTAAKSGYLGGGYGQRSVNDESKPLAVSGNSPITAQLRLWQHGVISGRVIDDIGEPAVALVVDALVLSEQSVTTRLIRAATAVTDDRGNYRLLVRPGEYIVFLPASGSQPRLRSQGTGAPGFSVTFYPGTSRASDASVIHVRSGDVRDGVDVALSSTKGVRVSGRILLGNVAEPLRLDLVRDTGVILPAGVADSQPSILGGDGSFVFDNVVPGTYQLRARTQPLTSGGLSMTKIGSQGMVFLGPIKPGEPVTLPALTPMHWARYELAVGTDHLQDLSIELKPGIELSGKVVFRGTHTLPPGDRLLASLLSLTSLDEPDSGGGLARIETDHTFRFQPVLPGRYVLESLLSFREWTPERVVMNGTDITHFHLSVSESSSDVTLTLTDQRPSSLAGFIRSRRGDAVPFATVYLFPEDDGLWNLVGGGTLARSVGADQHGSFVISNVRPGNYLVLAESELRETWRRPEIFAEMKPRAVTVRLRPGEQRPLTLTTGR